MHGLKTKGFVREGVLLNTNADIIWVGETHLRDKEELKLDCYIFKGNNWISLHINAPKGSGGMRSSIKELLLQNYSYTVLDKSREFVNLNVTEDILSGAANRALGAITSKYKHT